MSTRVEIGEAGVSSPPLGEAAWPDQTSAEALRRPVAGRPVDEGSSDYPVGVRVLRTRALCTCDGRPATPSARDVEVFARPWHDRSAHDGSILLWVVGTRGSWSLVGVHGARVDLRDREGGYALRVSSRRVDLGDGIWCENFDQVLADALRVVDRLAVEGLGQPRWDRAVEWLWSQDDAVPREDTVERAWARLFGGAVPPELVQVADPTWSSGVRAELGPHWISVVDRGDGSTLLDAQGRVYYASYPGASRLGVLRGSLAWERRQGLPSKATAALDRLDAVSRVVALRRSFEHASLDRDAHVDMVRSTLRCLHAHLVVGPVGSRRDPDDPAWIARMLDEHPPGHAREGRVVDLPGTSPGDSAHDASELDQVEAGVGVALVAGSGGAGGASAVLDRGLCRRMLSDVSDDDTHALAAQLGAALAEVDRLSGAQSGAPQPAYRCGCGCGREQLAAGPSFGSGISPREAAALGWVLDADPSLVRSPLCRGGS